MKPFHKYLLLILAINFACNENEEPREGFGKLTILGVELSKNLSANNGRINADKIWKHSYVEKFDLSFEHQNGETFQLSINPNNFEKTYSLELPLGNYIVKADQSGSELSELLPLKTETTLDLANKQQDWILPVGSDYGLISISNKNLDGKPTISSHPSSDFFNRSEDYYIYIKNGVALDINLPLSNPSHSFHVLKSSKSYTHQQIQLLKNGEASEDYLSDDFEKEEERINLDNENKPLNLSPLIIGELGSQAIESSGIEWIQGRLFSINDSENEAKIQEINPENGEVIREIEVTNASNIDWEELTVYQDHLYIGDFGNNLGMRQDLTILKIPISNLLASDNTIADKIHFNFSDQTDFNVNGNFDCESFFIFNNQFHLFSKNTADGKTKHYTLPLNGSSQIATLLENYDVQGLITSADISEDGTKIVLLGYEDKGLNSKSFIWLISEFTDTKFFQGKIRRTFLGSPAKFSQTEGVVFFTNEEIYISGEEINFGGLYIPPRLLKMNVEGLF
ncbi:hypothetical protein [Algoriphagus machipongonensis]|uniref:Uncharacterized protein n=1 Tax=Algoriphagus machipongonensis TaxID=388413 RepID=A3I1S6_9BACT|nr:hypothetical protein [Algoriphagus machipongonensis]EAZ79742.1 hypothetical protein ALPR1_08958 [Algoriphagus machipongonensis]